MISFSDPAGSVVDGRTWWAGAGFVSERAVSRDWVVTLGSGPF